MRYLLFGSCHDVFAEGGAHDLLGTGGSVQSLLAIPGKNIEWFHVFDTETGEIVAGSEKQAVGSPQLDEELWV